MSKTNRLVILTACLIIFNLLFFLQISAFAQILSKQAQGFNYSLYLPSDYSASDSWPLVITFHPSTGRGKPMVEWFVEAAEKKGYIVAGPDSADSAYWSFSEVNDVFRMIDQISSEYNINQKRIYLTGFSAGAIMTYYAGLKFPEKFRAIAPFSGRLRSIEQDGYLRLSPDKVRHIPVLILHGKTDNILNIEEAFYARQRLSQLGYDVRLRELSGLGHEYPAYINWIIINWFEKFK